MKILLTLVISFCIQAVQAQDVLLSLPYSTIANVNPALAGAINTKNSCVLLLQQPQMSNLDKGAIVSYQQKQARFNKDYLGWGISLGEQTADIFTKTFLKTTIAYGKYLGSTPRGGAHYLAAGGEWAYQQHLMDVSPFYGTTTFVGTPSADGYLHRQFADMSIGALWMATWKNGKSAYLGLALQHLNTPNIGFLENKLLPRRYTLHTGCELPLRNQLRLVPSAIVMQQGSTTTIRSGLAVKATAMDSLGIQMGVFICFANTLNIHPTSKSLAFFAKMEFKQSAIHAAYTFGTGQPLRNNGLEIAFMQSWGVLKNRSERLPVW
jgi:type IX secretion system PorP/SprF family membrane protein